MEPDAALVQFTARYVESLEQLEILCLLSRERDKQWSAKELFHIVQSSEKSVAACLEAFHANGLVAREASGLFRFRPARPELERSAQALCQAYHERRVSVIEMIYRKPGQTVQAFADAFRIRKRE